MSSIFPAAWGKGGRDRPAAAGPGLRGKGGKMTIRELLGIPCELRAVVNARSNKKKSRKKVDKKQSKGKLQ
jgi:hypothetical protein